MAIEKKLDDAPAFGPNTAGLAQRIYLSRTEDKQLYVLRKAYINTCNVNQF